MIMISTTVITMVIIVNRPINIINIINIRSIISDIGCLKS